MSKSCPNFIAFTFAHVLGATGLTAVGTQYNIIPTENPGVSLLSFLAIIGLTYAIQFLQPGVPKYLAFLTFIFLFSQILRPLEDNLQQKGILFEVFVMTLGIFIPMVLLGLYDKYNILSWGNYLLFALIGLIIARIILYAVALTGYYNDQNLTLTSQILSTFAVALFGLLSTYDVNLIKLKAKQCKSNPDYVDSSLGLFLDLLNIFVSSADILDN
jgi:FtsH-binding integral membrane protein